MNGLPILSLIILTPAAGALLLSFVDRKNEALLKQGALMVSCVSLLLSLTMLSAFDGNVGTYQLEESFEWVPSLGISYHLGIDGISVLLVLLTTFTMPIVLLSTWRAVSDRVKEYQIALLLLQTGMLGAFLALDLVLFYLFWEAMLIPMYLIVGIWGGRRRIHAAVKFFIYTMVGSLLMFVAILYLYKHTGTFDLPEMLTRLRSEDGGMDRTVQAWLFGAFALSFAIKVPIFPLHTWLPLAHVEAPTAGSVVLAGILLKMGTYGFLRFGIPLFPEAAQTFTPLICWLAVVGIIYGACMALVQNDIKKLVAYSSVSHLGFVVLGIFMFRMSNGDMSSTGIVGAILQMVNHGLSTGMLFLMIGIMYERRHTRELANYGGLAKVVPVFSTFFIIATLSSIGLPGLNGFVGEFLILFGTFKVDPTLAVFASTGVVLGAVYMLTLCKRFLFGPLVHEENSSIRDLTAREVITLAPIVVLMVWIGLYPNSFTGLVEPTVQQYLELLK